MSDALVLASIGGAELWQATQKDYMERNPKPYMMVSANLHQQNDAGSSGQP